MSEPGRVLGLDVGQKRIGVAVSDLLQITAQGRENISGEDVPAAIAILAEQVVRDKVIRVVVGIPMNMNGTPSAQTASVVKFKEALEQKLSIPVVTWDERMTTMQAESVLIDANMSRKKRKRVVDGMAAQIILQAYLDANRGNI